MTWQAPRGGVGPYNRDSRELYYGVGQQVMAVSVSPTRDALVLGTPVLLFSLKAGTIPLRARTDGRQFLVARQTEDVPAPPLTVIVNWNRGGRQAVPGGNR